MITVIVVLLLFSLVYPSDALAQVVINEVLNNPSGTESGAEWVELYNLGIEVASLNGCILYLDDSTTTQKVIFGEEDFVDKFRVISWDSSWLNNSGDLVKLECGAQTDSVSYGNQAGSVVLAPDDGVSFGRSPDGIGNFLVLSTVTLGDPNSNPPTPTIEPSDTPVPTSTPKPTPTTKPTSTPKPTPTIKITSEPTSTSELEGLSVLSNNNNENDGSEDNTPLGGSEVKVLAQFDDAKSTINSEKKFPFPALIFIFGGIVFMGAAIYRFVRISRKTV